MATKTVTRTESVTDQQKDMANHPSHYNQGSIETIDFIEDQHFDFHIGTAIRYLCRAGHKWNEIEDLEKAIWYIQRKIDALKKAKEGIEQHA